MLYLEAHVPVNISDPISHLNIISADDAVRDAVKGHHFKVDWGRVDQTIQHQLGVPVAIGDKSPTSVAANN